MKSNEKFMYKPMVTSIESNSLNKNENLSKLI